MYLKLYSYLLVPVLLIIMFLQMFLSTLDDSPYNDEQVNILAGLSYINFWDLRANPEHPPLTRLLSALSVKLFYPDLKFTYPKEEFEKFNYLQGFANELFTVNNHDRLLITARLPMMLLTLLFALFLFFFTRKIAGAIPSIIALFLFTFEPNFLALGKAVVTDGALAGFVFLSCMTLYLALSKKNLIYWFCFYLFMLLAVMSKHTGLIFFPIFFLSSLIYLVLNKSNRKKYMKFTFFYFISFLAVILSIWGFYWLFYKPLFLYHEMPQFSALYDKVNPQWIISFLRKNPLPYYYSYGMSFNFALGFFGQKAYLLEKWGPHNWWWFYPVTFILKTPLLYLLIFLCSLVISLKDNRIIFCFTVFIMYLLFVIFSPLAIGMRILLPLSYLMIFIIAISAAKILTNRIALIILISLISLSAFIRLLSFPNYLSHINALKIYFNKYSMMVDTNYEWGQDVKRLAIYFKNKGINSIYYTNEAAAQSSLYGLEGKKVPYNFEEPKPKGYIAVNISARNFPISVKTADGREGGYEHPFSWLDQYPVYKVIGETILIYFVP